MRNAREPHPTAQHVGHSAPARPGREREHQTDDGDQPDHHRQCLEIVEDPRQRQQPGLVDDDPWGDVGKDVHLQTVQNGARGAVVGVVRPDLVGPVRVDVRDPVQRRTVDDDHRQRSHAQSGEDRRAADHVELFREVEDLQPSGCLVRRVHHQNRRRLAGRNRMQFAQQRTLIRIEQREPAERRRIHAEYVGLGVPVDPWRGLIDDDVGRRALEVRVGLADSDRRQHPWCADVGAVLGDDLVLHAFRDRAGVGEQRSGQGNGHDQPDRDRARPGEPTQREVEHDATAGELASDAWQRQRDQSREHQQHGKAPDEWEDDEERTDVDDCFVHGHTRDRPQA